MNKRFFYTKYAPGEWSSGARIVRLNDEFLEIKSLDEARELAEKYNTYSAQTGVGYLTTYGVEYRVE